MGHWRATGPGSRPTHPPQPSRPCGRYPGSHPDYLTDHRSLHQPQPRYPCRPAHHPLPPTRSSSSLRPPPQPLPGLVLKPLFPPPPTRFTALSSTLSPTASPTRPQRQPEPHRLQAPPPAPTPDPDPVTIRFGAAPESNSVVFDFADVIGSHRVAELVTFDFKTTSALNRVPVDLADHVGANCVGLSVVPKKE